MIIFYNSKTHDCEIEATGETISIDQARQYWLDDKIDDSNMAFQRLVQSDFDPGTVEQLYRDMEATRRS